MNHHNPKYSAFFTDAVAAADDPAAGGSLAGAVNDVMRAMVCAKNLLTATSLSFDRASIISTATLLLQRQQFLETTGRLSAKDDQTLSRELAREIPMPV